MKKTSLLFCSPATNGVFLFSFFLARFRGEGMRSSSCFQVPKAAWRPSPSNVCQIGQRAFFIWTKRIKKGDGFVCSYTRSALWRKGSQAQALMEINVITNCCLFFDALSMLMSEEILFPKGWQLLLLLLSAHALMVPRKVHFACNCTCLWLIPAVYISCGTQFHPKDRASRIHHDSGSKV